MQNLHPHPIKWIKSQLRVIGIIQCFYILMTTFSLSAQENFTLLYRAAEIFQKEKKEIKNYKVHQEVASTIKETSGIVIEKRIQTGYFRSPEEFIFVGKEIEINGVKQILTKPVIEKFNKSEKDWLSKEGLTLHSFQVLSTDSKIIKYLVNPLKIQSGFYRGQIWVDQNNAKIIKILKEPIIKKREILKYSLELNFDRDFKYQAPSRTLLVAIYKADTKITEIEVEANFKDYEFNLDLNREFSQ